MFEGFEHTLKSLVYVLFYYFVFLNINLALFNLIPIPPLDGSRILYMFLPLNVELKLHRYEQYIMIGLFVLIWIGLFDWLSIVSAFVFDCFTELAAAALFFL